MALMNYSWKEASRKNWMSQLEKEDDIPTDQIQAGAIMRIADAVEVMAKNYNELIRERGNFERWYKEERERKNKLNRSNSAFRGHITRLKKRLTLYKEEHAALIHK
jgi:predicted Rossmann fold nucleotide-binding protein DprA/Smf involved in DNA uptake